MDITISNKKKSNHKPWVFSVIGVILAFFIVKYLWHLSLADFSVDRDTLQVSQVKRGDFTVSVRGTGVLAPDNVKWLSAEAEATVSKVVVKAGNIVKKGDLIVELTNPQLVQQLAEAKWELQAQEAESRADEVADELALLEQKGTVLNYKMNYESGLLRQKAQEQLLSTNAVSKLDYERTVLETAQFKKRWNISQNQYEKMRQNLIAQNNAREARLNKMRKIKERVAEQVDNLKVKATMNSVVLAMPLEPGQRIIMGANIAKLAQKDSLIAELQVPEIEIRDVAVGQRVIVDTRNSKIEGRVSRVDPAVVNGNVQVDVTFEGELPSDARPDLSVDGEIKIAELPDSLYVDRPLFSQSQSESAFYKLNEDGSIAERVKVEVGYGSVNQIQIIEGLKAGDRIITSDPSRFQSYGKFHIN